MRAYARNLAPSPERDRLVAEHVEMARRIALKHARALGEGPARDDLVAAALLALTEAADRFEGGGSDAFAGFATKRVLSGVLAALARIVKRPTHASLAEVGAVIAELEGKMGRVAEDEEIAKALGMEVNVFRAELGDLANAQLAAADVAGEAGQRELATRLRAGLAKIPEADAIVLALYHVEDLHYAEIGQVLEVPESRVAQLHARALARLRAALEKGAS